ncbi:hypothetical protein H9I32_24240 [Bacillus sp. Xin]|uniref:hypothetical protein n=1 Tax=unclassified Bacillus (in: firmicutes) TaxID=185979 RepID=UPI001571B56C|nr:MULTISPECIES: hypothetical protein [unclassified Bacillus (in: firmicutes)]MBC6975362.1 hypothetical protein [Bacillus sp. Xin]MCI0765966.1 hypothetical protein [Bacillus sp. TL12]NSW37605.1 hypothetical protein [Bacillus sp. Xin1]
MLTFEEKLSIIESFPQLERKNVSLKRVNFHFEESRLDKKNVVYHLHPNGNGFVYAGGIKGYKTDDKGMVNIREFSADELRSLIQKSIELLSQEPEEIVVQAEPAKEEEWQSEEGHILTLIHEDDMWNVYAGVNLDGTFNSYPEAAEYLDEEGFSRK